MIKKHHLVKKNTLSFILTLILLFSNQTLAKNKFLFTQAYNTSHIFHHTSIKFLDNLKNESSSYYADYHPGGDLGDWTSQFEQAMLGVIPMTMAFGASEFDHRLDLTWLGYVVDNWEKAKKVYGPSGEMITIYNQIFADMDLIALGIIPTGFGSITISKGVNKIPTRFPEDAKGIKMRVIPSPLAVQRFKNWGFSPVPMPYSELYTALQLGTVDGRAFGPAVEIYQMRDVLESYILTRDYFEHAFWLVNKHWWLGLPEQERNKLQRAINKTLQWVWQEAETIDNQFLEKVKKANIKIIELNADEQKQAKAILYANEWPYMEKKVGKNIMDKVRRVAGVKSR